MIKCPAVEESRRARVRGIRARPEDTVLLVDLLVGNAIIVTDTTSRYATQLTKNILDTGIGKQLPGSQTSSQVAHNLPVRTRLARRSYRLPDADDPAFGVGDSAFVLFLQ